MLPGGPRNARQMEMMMRRLGMTTEEVHDDEEVIIRTKQHDQVFHQPEVTILTVQGTRTYQVVGNPEILPRGAAGASAPGGTSAPTPPVTAGPPEEDVELVMAQAGVDHDTAVRALAAAGGEPAEAILKLLSRPGARGPG